jgi:hypothetical protein
LGRTCSSHLGRGYAAAGPGLCALTEQACGLEEEGSNQRYPERSEGSARLTFGHRSGNYTGLDFSLRSK